MSLWLPTSHHEREKFNEERLSRWRLYLSQHEACPQCRSKNVARTTVGLLEPPDLTNIAKCACGWRGKVHDMIQLPESIEVD